MSNPAECRHDRAAGGDFCPDCGAYLAWDLPDLEDSPPADIQAASLNGTSKNGTSAVAVFDPPSPRAAGAPPPISLAAITLREDVRPEDPIVVEPGATVTLHARVRNQSEIVDEFTLAVELDRDFESALDVLDADWWTIEPKALYLLPFGTGRPSSCEGDATVTLTPARSWRATAGIWPLKITVGSKHTEKTVASVPVTLDVKPYQDVRLTVDPEVSRRRRPGLFDLAVENAGNAPIKLTTENAGEQATKPAAETASGEPIRYVLAGRSREGECRVSFDPGELAPAPGEKRVTKVRARAIPLVVGRPVDHVLTLLALRPGDDLPDGEGPGSLREQALGALAKRGDGAAKGELKKLEKSPVAKRASELAKMLGIKRPGAASEAKPGTPEAAAAAATAAVASTNKDDDDKPPSVTCTYRQRAWLPWWTGVLLAVAVIALALLIKPWLDGVPVPNVLGHYISKARAQIDKPGLKGTEVTQVIAKAMTVNTQKKHHAIVPLTPGDVFKELHDGKPVVGKELLPGTSVELVTAVWPGKATVPDLSGLTPTAAEHRLSVDGFAIGDFHPYPAPMGEVIVAQNPKALTKHEPRTTIIDVTLGKLAAVPDLVGHTTAGAQQMLLSGDLVLGQVTGQPRPGVTAAPVIAAQSHPPDATLVAGSEVNVTLGVRVPKLKGVNLAKARRKLKAAGLLLGALKPSKPPTGDVVIGQSRGARTIVPFGTKLVLALGPPPTKKKKAAKKAKSGASAPVPAVAGATAAAAAAAIAKAGATTRQTFAISATVAAGKLLSTIPAAGSKMANGGVVTLVISAGFPEIAVAKGSSILTLSGVTGKILAKVVSGPQAASEPSWSTQGTDIAYVSAGRIMITAAQGPSGPKALTGAGSTFMLPTFPATSTAPDVLAAISRASGGADELCLLAVAHPRPSCLRAQGWTLGNEITWSPDGTELLVGASKSPGTVGLLKFTSRTPFSTRRSDWSRGRLVTPTVSGAGVRAAAFSPGGDQLALAEDLGSPYSLALVAPNDLMLTKATNFAAPTPACSVQWRADSKQVLVQTSNSSDCSKAVGSVYIVDPAHPRALALIATGVADAVWQPLPGVG